MDSHPALDPHDAESLIALFRRTIHEANNELMAIVQECELALLKKHPDALEKAVEFAIGRAMAISRLHRSTRQEILECLKRPENGEVEHGHLDRGDGGSVAD